MAREKWVLGRCGMAVLCMDMTFWTSEVFSILNKTLLFKAERYMIEEGYLGANKFGNDCNEAL